MHYTSRFSSYANACVNPKNHFASYAYACRKTFIKREKPQKCLHSFSKLISVLGGSRHALTILQTGESIHLTGERFILSTYVSKFYLHGSASQILRIPGPRDRSNGQGQTPLNKRKRETNNASHTSHLSTGCDPSPHQNRVNKRGRGNPYSLTFCTQ